MARGPRDVRRIANFELLVVLIALVGTCMIHLQ